MSYDSVQDDGEDTLELPKWDQLTLHARRVAGAPPRGQAGDQ